MYSGAALLGQMPPRMAVGVWVAAVCATVAMILTAVTYCGGLRLMPLRLLKVSLSGCGSEILKTQRNTYFLKNVKVSGSTFL